ncbi:MAG: hypothetical protein KGQ94_05805, partial [Alphaproteobacteria bacterium]|nr:hypothetical protein [Alphaproteobacteria bacterium]
WYVSAKMGPRRAAAKAGRNFSEKIFAAPLKRAAAIPISTKSRQKAFDCRGAGTAAMAARPVDSAERAKSR